MKKAAFVYSKGYLNYNFGPGHPLNPLRLEKTYDLIKAYGLLNNSEALLVTPEPATEEQVELVHDGLLVQIVHLLSLGETVHGSQLLGLGGLDTPPFLGMYEASLLYTGGSIQAGKLVSQGQTQSVFNPAGGLHHAHRARASGYCVFNDAAIAIQALLSTQNRILYLDIDAHHGDGVQEAFYKDPRVMTISLHETGETLFPGTGNVTELGQGSGIGYSVNIPLAPYTNDEIWLWAYNQIVPALIRSFDPETIVLQFGVDAHFLDPLAHLELTSHLYEKIIQEILVLRKPLVVLGGGGYHPDTVPRIWTLLFAKLLGIKIPDEIPTEFTEKYGINRIRDSEQPAIEQPNLDKAWIFAENTVKQIMKRIFPIHGI